MTTILQFIWFAGMLPTVLLFLFLQGYVNRRFAEKKMESRPPMFIGAILSPAWPAVFLFMAIFYLGRSAYSVGAGLGARVNSEVAEARQMVAERDLQFAQISRLALDGKTEELKALINPDDALRVIAAHQRQQQEALLDLSEPEILPARARLANLTEEWN